MLDRFKLRCFNKFQNKIYDVKSISYIDGIVKRIEVQDEERILIFDEWQKNIDNTVLMQCTGLSDKNGKEIYEGDILDLYVSSKKLYRYEVKYEIGSFMLVSQDEIFDFPNVWNDYVYPLSQLYYEYQNEEDYIYQCEVVGNIYENPELLENN